MNEDGQNLNNLPDNQSPQPTTLIQEAQQITEQPATSGVSNRRTFLLLALAVVVLLVISGSFYYIFHYLYVTNTPKQELLRPTATPQKQTNSVNHFTQADQQRLEAGLVSQNVTVLRKVLADEVAAQVKTAILPPGSKIIIDINSFKIYSPKLATISAVVAGQKPGKYTFQLIYEDNEWKVLGTSLQK